MITKLGTFRDVFEEELDRNEASGYHDIDENCRWWLSKMGMIERLIAGEFAPMDYPLMCFPNWFEREHAETLLGRTLTEEEWLLIIDEAGDVLASVVSEAFEDYLTERWGK